jgi:hypothetical protein
MQMVYWWFGIPADPLAGLVDGDQTYPAYPGLAMTNSLLLKMAYF